MADDPYGYPGGNDPGGWGPPPVPPPSAWPSPPGGYPRFPGGVDPVPGGAGTLAGWWRRVGATLIDGIIIAVIARICKGLSGSEAVYLAVGLLLGVAYTTVLIGGPTGRTVGMMAVGTRCVDADHGGAIGYGRGFVRWLLSELLAVTIVGGLLDALWPLWDGRNQTIHDKVAKSIVIRTA
jgi:uncharacterized RDD family membrane protein YckC